MVKAFSSKNLREHGKYDDDMKDWLDELPQISFKETRQLTIRPVTSFIMMARHWPVVLTNGKNTPPMWCPKFNSETQKFDLDYACCLHDDFGDRWKAQKTIIFAAIVREWQEDGKKNPVGIIVLPGSTSSTLVQIVGINKYDVSDQQKGCDLSVVYAKEAAAAQRWQIQRTDRSPLTDEEKAYRIPDLEKVSPDFGDPSFLAMYAKETKRKLSNFAYYVTPKGNDAEGWDAYKKDVNGQPYTDFPDLLALVGDGKDKDGKDGKDAPKKKSFEDQPKKLTRKHDVVDDEEEDTPPPKKAKAPPPDDEDDDVPPPVKKKAAPVEDDEEEDAPPPKKSKPAKDDEAEAPFEPDEEKPAPKKLKVLGPLDGAEDWSETFSIQWKKNDEGDTVPKCFGVFAGAKKCKACPVKKACTAADSE